MQDSERMALLLEMRKRFRAARPDLNLSADAEESLGEAGDEAVARSRQAAQQKLDELGALQDKSDEAESPQSPHDEPKKKPPGRAAKLIQRYLQSK